MPKFKALASRTKRCCSRQELRCPEAMLPWGNRLVLVSLILKDRVQFNTGLNSLLCMMSIDVPYSKMYKNEWHPSAHSKMCCPLRHHFFQGVSPILMSEVATWVVIGLKIRMNMWLDPYYHGMQLSLHPKLTKTELKVFQPSTTACLLQIQSFPVTLLVRFRTYPNNLGRPPWCPPWPIPQISGVPMVNRECSLIFPLEIVQAVQGSIYLPLIYTSPQLVCKVPRC